MPLGKMLNGDRDAREVSGRIAGSFATTALLKALPVANRTEGMLATVQTGTVNSLWIFDSNSAIGASATILVPDAGSGRWIHLATGAVA